MTKKKSDEVKIKVPELTTKQKLINKYFWWWPINRRFGGYMATALVKVTERVLTIQKRQDALIKNYNTIILELRGEKMTKAAREEKEKKRIKEDRAFQ